MAFSLGQARARAAEARLEVEPHREGRFLRQRERRASASASGVEHAAVRAHPRPLEGLEHLRAAPVLEHRVVVLAAEAGGGRLAEGGVVDRPHEAIASA